MRLKNPEKNKDQIPEIALFINKKRKQGLTAGTVPVFSVKQVKSSGNNIGNEQKTFPSIFFIPGPQPSPMSIVELVWPFLFPAIAAIIAVISILVKQYHGAQALETFLMWQIAIGLGLGYLYAGMGHLFFADRVAESIGWPVGSPFQREVGMWDAAMGIVGLLCLKFRDTGFWTATAIGAGIFSVSAGFGHVYEMVVNGNYSPNNAGPVMYMDILYPVFLVGLLLLLHRKRSEEVTRLEKSS
jgi:hypothetical protein